MAFDRISENLRRLNENIRAFSQSSAEYYKLELYKISMKSATMLVKMLALGILLLFFISFLSIAAAIWISNELEVPSSGFFIVAGFYLLLVLFMKVFGGAAIEKLFLIKSSRKVFNKQKEEPEMQVEKEEKIADHETV